MRIPSLLSIAQLVRHVRLGLFSVMLAISGTQIVTLMRGPANEAPGHFIVAAVTLGVGVRLFLAKKSSFNRAAAEIERRAARNRDTQ